MSATPSPSPQASPTPTPFNEVILGSRVLITGAARGMGALYARRAVAEGASAVALWDIDAEEAGRLAEELRLVARPGLDPAQVEVFPVDISRLEAVQEGAAAVRERMGVPDVVVNNAGIVRGAPFWEHRQAEDTELTMRVNALAPMWITREFLLDMMADTSRPKRVLNIASAAGTVANPNMSVYAASKWALIGWSESLRLELERNGSRHMAVTVFCPSYVSTGMFDGARGPLFTPIMTPEQASGAAWEGMIKGTPVVTKPWTVKLGMSFRGILPTRAWDAVAGRVFKVYSSMDEFTGRKG